MTLLKSVAVLSFLYLLTGWQPPAPGKPSVAAPLTTSGITCAQLGVTCIFETSFTSAQGWTTDRVHDFGCGGAGLDGVQTGIKQENDEAAIEGHCEEVVSAANYSGGAGGRGQRHWIDDGAVNASGFLLYDWTDLTTRKTEVWIRYFIRTNAGIGLTVDHRPNYFNGSNCQSGGGSCYFLFESPTGGLRVTVDGGNFANTLADYDWNTLFSGNKGDGNWHCYEFHAKSETASGTSLTGVGEWWIDGTLRYQNTAIDWNNFGDGFGGIVIPESGNFNTTGGTAYPMDIDDIAVSATSRIRGTGCGS